MISKEAFPVDQIRHWLEPGPVVLISSHQENRYNIMTLGWHTIMDFSPSLVGCMISSANHSFEMIKQSGECVINLPTIDLAETVSKIGNCDGDELDKFNLFNLTPDKSHTVSTPGIRECHASFECRIYDDTLASRYNFFIFEVVHARVRPEPEWPQTLHYTGDGVFRTDGEIIDCHRLFTKVT